MPLHAMQPHEAIGRLIEAGYAPETASRLVAYALKAGTQGGWVAFAPEAFTRLTKAEAQLALARACIDPDEVRFPPWYRPTFLAKRGGAWREDICRGASGLSDQPEDEEAPSDGFPEDSNSK